MRHKLVIYTAIIGGNYDFLHQPMIVEDNVDYICFVKKGSRFPSRNGVWEIREVDYENKDNTRIARYIKMHPHILFPDNEYSLWIDGNIHIATSDLYSIVDEKIDEGVLLSSMFHPHLDCCYDDAYVCMASHKDKIYRIVLQLLYLKFHGFPKNYGLYETNVFYRKHSSEKVIQFNNLWWHLLSNLSRRDQLGCTYSMWKIGIPMNYLLPKGLHARNSKIVNYYPHKDKAQVRVKQGKLRNTLYSWIIQIVGYRKNKE